MPQDLINTPTIAGLPLTKANPAFSKNTFKTFVPNFADYIDSENGKVEHVINVLPVPSIINVDTELSFNNTFVGDDKKVLNIDDNNDIILGKITPLCYKKGYNILSEIIIDNPGASEEIIIVYYVNIIQTTNMILVDTISQKSILITR